MPKDQMTTKAKLLEEFRHKFEGANTSSNTINVQVDYLTQALNDYTESIVRMVDEQIKIWKSMDEDLPVPRLQDQIVEALNDIKEALNDTK